ncbi:hypothetical protein N7504_010827 [Penicillium tannophilum]|nr:hypothetical protein N7504_010827 [Penicillium tannophilum]
MLDDINVKEISDTKEPKSISKDLIDVDDKVEDNDTTIRFTTTPSQVRISGRKRKHINNKLYKYY